MSLQWPDSAKKAMALFFTKWNDIDVYTEDTALHAESLYRALLTRMLDGKARIEKIFPLGGRPKVIDACRADKQPGGRPRIYLIDGDLDLLLGKREPVCPRLFQHHVYAVENYLLDEEGLIEILHEENPRLDPNTIRERLDFSGWKESIKELPRLFVLFAVSKQLLPEAPTISMGIGKFLSGGKSPRLDKGKVDSFWATRKRELLGVSTEAEIQEACQVIEERLGKASDVLDYLAGRDFVFPLLKQWIASAGLTLKCSSEGLNVRLAKVASLDRHAEFIGAIRATAKSAR